MARRAPDRGGRQPDRYRLDDQRRRVDLTRRDRDCHVVVAAHRNPVNVRSTKRKKRLAGTVDRDFGFADRCVVRSGHALAPGSPEPEREGGIGKTVGRLLVRVGLDPRRKRIPGDGELSRLVGVDGGGDFDPRPLDEHRVRQRFGVGDRQRCEVVAAPPTSGAPPPAAIPAAAARDRAAARSSLTGR